MAALPRGTCPECGADVALRKGGLVREHRDPRPALNRVCPGSGKRAVTSMLGDQMVTVQVTATVAVANDRPHAERDADELVRRLLAPHVRSVTNWEGRFAIITGFSTATHRV